MMADSILKSVRSTGMIYDHSKENKDEGFHTDITYDHQHYIV